MKRSPHLVFVLLLISLCVMLPAFVHGAASLAIIGPDDAGWEILRDEAGIQSHKCVLPDSTLLAFRGEGVVDAPLARVMSVLFDANRVGEWIPRMAESRVLRWIDEPIEYVQYTRFDAPWPVSDRVFLSHVVVEVDEETHRTIIHYYNSEDDPPSDRWIRGFNGGSYYILEPEDEGRRTRIIGVGMADPQGNIPPWLINWMGRSWPYDTIVRLQQQVTRPDVVEIPAIARLYQGQGQGPGQGQAAPGTGFAERASREAVPEVFIQAAPESEGMPYLGDTPPVSSAR